MDHLREEISRKRGSVVVQPEGPFASLPGLEPYRDVDFSSLVSLSCSQWQAHQLSKLIEWNG